MFSFSKQPGETIIGVGIDFSPRINASETLTVLTVTSVLLSGVETVGSALTITNKAVSGSIAACTLSGGYDSCTYKLTYRVTGTEGSVLESEIKLKVKEI
jgi:hypothetical protein